MAPTLYNVQSILFDKKNWTKNTAIKWLDSHGYKHYKIDITQKKLRFRQENPNYILYRYRTITLPNGIEFIVGFKKLKDEKR